MAKPRRPLARHKTAHPSGGAARPSEPAAARRPATGLSAAREAPAAQTQASVARTPPSSQRPQRRSTYFEAVALYERALEKVQQHDYEGAAVLLESVLTQYPEEKELLERAQLYLNVCRRQATPKAAVPQTIDERLYASTLAINGGRYDEAISHLRLVRDEDPDNDHALYMLAAAHAQRG